MSALFTLAEVLAATGGRAVNLSGVEFSSISIDSRDLGPDALFVAIKGDRFDGHDFVAMAQANGAVAALVAEDRAGGLSGPLIVVADALAGLEALGRAARARSGAKIVAVTGSVGKTTTKEALRLTFAAAGQTHASLKSFNNHWGVPLTLARLPREAAFGVFEIGMNHAGEILALVDMVRPHIAIVTTIAPAHLAAFGSLDGIARAKAEIFSGLVPGGVALLNADHEQVGLLVAEAEAIGATVVTYGFAAGSDYRITDYGSNGDSARAEIHHGDSVYPLAIAGVGRHMISNAAVAFAAGRIAGVPAGQAIGALKTFGAQAGRGQRRMLGPMQSPLLLIDESYNANTASMLAALEVFAGIAAPNGKKVIVLGDMLELGEQSAALHAGLAPAVLASGADAIYLVGEHVAALAEALGPERVSGHATTAQEMADRLTDALAYGDAVMIKGSNGVRLATIIERIGERFQ